MGTSGSIVLALIGWIGALWIIGQIEKVYGNPRKFDNKDFVDVTAWFA